MATLQDAVETQIKNIEKKTGKTLAVLKKAAESSGLSKHAELRAMFMKEFGLGHGDANALVHAVQKSDGTRAAEAKGATTPDVLGEIYAGPKMALRPIHDALMKHIVKFGDFETLPKKGYVSLRRKKQFAMLGPATQTRFELGLNDRNLKGGARLEAQPEGSMCHFKVKLTDVAQVDAEVIAWLKQAFDASA